MEVRKYFFKIFFKNPVTCFLRNALLKDSAAFTGGIRMLLNQTKI
jgi:hypothetical protein